jgi:hypothetical protein
MSRLADEAKYLGAVQDGVDSTKEELESLRQQLTQALSERNALNRVVTETEEELLESQAYADRLWETLEMLLHYNPKKVWKVGVENGEYVSTGSAHLEAITNCELALALPHDHTALDAYVAEKEKAAKVEALRDAAMHYEKQMFDHIAAGLRSMAKEIEEKE